MCPRVICVVAVLAFALPATSAADTIRLKNGRTISAAHVRQENGRVEYDVGDDHYALPLSLVDRVERAPLPVLPEPSAQRRPDAAPELPVIHSERPGIPADLAARLVQDGRVDPDVLNAVEKSGDLRVAALAYDYAGAAEQDRGNLERASTYFLRGLNLAPDTPLLHAHYASLLMQSERYRDAVQYAERAVRLAPNSADYLAVLGFAYFLSDRSREAIAPWKRSLALAENDTVRQYLGRAERELAAEANYGQQETSHFILRYEGRETSPAMRKQILDALESDFDTFVATFGVAPRESIPVILYTNEAFVDVTASPRWADAVNDGKLRIPIDHLESMNDDLARVLRHELAHSFINYMTHGRAPQWLHEGVAQLSEPRALGPRGPWLARLAGENQWQPFNVLETSFLHLNATQAAIAYTESLAAAEFIRSQYGMPDLCRVLQRIGEGASTEAALRTIIHTGYAGLQDDVAAYVTKTYGH